MSLGPGSTTIRLALPEELSACAALYEQVANATFTWQPLGYAQAADFLRFAEEEEVWLARMGGELVGIASIYRPASFVHSLYVDPLHHGRGIGKALLEALAVGASHPLSLKVQLPAKQARAFYGHLGFRALGEGMDANGVGWILMRQEKAPALAMRTRRRRRR